MSNSLIILYRSVFFLATILLFSASCKDSDSTKSGDLPLPSWARQAAIYEVNTRQITPEGTFNALKSHLPRLKSLGTDILYLMPIHPLSMKKSMATNGDSIVTRAGTEDHQKHHGNPFAIADYHEVNPDFGTSADFKSLIDDIHRKNMKIIINWVPNYTGWDHVWISEHPEWYSQDKTGNIASPLDMKTGANWEIAEVAELNYNIPEMRISMIKAMKHWVALYDVDGFGVNMADNVPKDFWLEVKDELSGMSKSLFMMSESEAPFLRNSGTFHATYGWSFHALMNQISRSEKDVSDIKKWLKKYQKQFKKGFNINFTSNHITNTWEGTEIDRMGDAHKAMAVLAATIEGMPLLYTGQEIPLRKKLSFYEKDSIYWGYKEYEDFYKRLFNFKEENSALRNKYGTEIEFISESSKVLAFQKVSNNDKVIVIINLTDKEQTYKLDINFKMKVNILTGNLKDAVAGEEREIGPWKYYIIKS